MAIEIILPVKGFMALQNGVKTQVKTAITDCTNDLLRVASLRSPTDSGTLEQSGTSRVSTGSSITGEVSFRAVKRGYNYAYKMDTGKYNLGEKSKSKSASGVRSQFSKGTMKVGAGYLSDTIKSCEKGYKEHIQDKVDVAIKMGGFVK